MKLKVGKGEGEDLHKGTVKTRKKDFKLLKLLFRCCFNV